MKSYKITLLPGDGIGPEITNVTNKILELISKKFDFELKLKEMPFGGSAIEEEGIPFPDRTYQECKNSDAVLLAAIGDPKYDQLPREKRPETGLLKLRSSLDLFANIRPVKIIPSLTKASSLKEEFVKEVDLVVVRELTSGIYFGEPKARFKGNPQQDLLVALKSDGTIKWTLELEWDGFRGRMQTPTNSSPTISDNGIIYIGNGGKLYAIKTLSTDSDNSPWPMLGQNAQGHKRAPKIILPPVDPDPINPEKPIDVTGNAPYILEQPKSKTINAGQTVSFSVKVAGDQPISFQWFRDQALLANETKNSITIENANPNLDIGDYYVIAKNKNGSNKSINARLRIIDKSELQITNKIFKSGKRLVFQANTPFGEEGIVVQKTNDFKKWVDIKKILGLGLVTIIVDIEGYSNYYYRLKIGD